VIAQYDSELNKLTTRGQHHGTERIWVVQVRAEGLPDVLTFKPSGKYYLRDLADLIDKYLLQHIEETKTALGRVRWTATAR
jgi:hypothetical protein